jgi:hypothetical protein
MDRVERLEREKRGLQEEIQRLKGKPHGRIGYFLLSLGIVLLGLAVYYSHNVSAFIGIALTFWGALLLYIRPTQFVRKNVLDSIIIEPLQNTSRLLNDMEFNGKHIYISSPTLHGLRNVVLYIPKSGGTRIPSIERLSETGVLMENPLAVKLNPPGHRLSRLLEEELKTNFSTVDLAYLQYTLEKAFVEGLEIAEFFKMVVKDTTIHVEVGGNIFYELLEEFEEDLGEICICDPLSSALACILARSTHKPVVIERVDLISVDRKTITEFKLLDVEWG